MDKMYEDLKEMLEANLKKIVKKGDISPEDLCKVKEATSALDHINSLMGGANHYSAGVDRSPVTGRYISNGPHGNMRVSYGDSMGYSGHSIKDRMIARLEPMYDEARSDYERQLISNTINRIHNES